MSTLATLKTLLTPKLAQSNTGFHTEANRTAALNEACGDIAQKYEIPELKKIGTLTIVGGKCAIPTDMLRAVKVWDSSNNHEFLYLTEDEFDNKADTDSNYWTIDYDTATLTRVMKFKPTTTTSLSIRYIKEPVEMVNSADDCGYPATYNDAITWWASAILLLQERNYEAWKYNDQQANDMCQSAIEAYRKVGGVKQGERLRSYFEKHNLLD